MESKTDLSQMMRQYLRIKEKHKDHIVFFRLGDFYEMFFDDAILISKELELTLTSKACGGEEKAPMCGVPAKSYETYLARLIKKGYKVAIADQMELPSKEKKLVSREVVRIVTPGTIIENSMLEAGKNNYICALYLSGGKTGMAFCDVSTGEFSLTETSSDEAAGELSRFMPSEIIVNPGLRSYPKILDFLKKCAPLPLEQFPEEKFAFAKSEKMLLGHFGKAALEELGLKDSRCGVCAAGGLLEYIAETQRGGLENIRRIDLYAGAQYMHMDESARSNLELTGTIRSKERKGTLLWVLDRTRTHMGKRLIKNYINQPLLNPVAINRRLDAVEELVSDDILRGDLSDLLSEIYDLQRFISRIVYGSTTPREIKSLSYTCSKLPPVKQRLSGVKAALLRSIMAEIDGLGDIQKLIETAIDDDPPAGLRDGGVIRPGFNPEVDELREIIKNSKAYLQEVEAAERQKTGIKNLKIGFNNIHGYYIEISKSFLSQAPENYIRRQTLTNGERFITPELKTLESKILGASERIVQLETAIFESLRKQVADALDRIQLTARAIARLDVLRSFAEVSAQNNYTRPKIGASGEIRITGGRHPVIEQVLSGEPFVSNDTLLDKGKNQVMLITGPNMAGKSTYMRQAALIVLMAQIGCFVPAQSAFVGIVDRIFTRVGASDDLSSGRSTFMVEMSEVAYILKNATPDSFIILDEVGRGTSTYDGMSMARAILEHIADKKKLGAKTLFATHYHELTSIEEETEGVQNYSMAVKKRGEEISFIRRLTRGATSDSYGIDVSRLAGIPESIVRRAREVLAGIENGTGIKTRKSLEKKPYDPVDTQNQELIEKLKKADIETLTPLEALNFLYDLKKHLK
ncbi:MAG: DNA mismatch repair protein MutS [Oscillospiraceae bacterium]|jgi:DNA mismatch repair protein MutS|nr:DNA mismatch repair protein MutS [Oscillospiraceae bacterium]